MADATPYPLPAGSRLLQDLGFLAFTLPEVTILMPTKTPRGQELTREQQRANQALNQRRLRIEHVNSSVKRCRIVKDRLRLWKAGLREVRPIFVRKDNRTRGHVFVCLLALQLSRELQRRLAATYGTTKDDPHGVTLHDAPDTLHRLCLLT